MYAIAQPAGILVRMLAVALLISGTYNPSGYSYYHWAVHGAAGHWASKAVVGQLIVVALVFCTQATMRSLGLLLGIPLVLLFGAGIWLLSNWGIVDLSDGLQHPDRRAGDHTAARHRRQHLPDPLSPERTARFQDVDAMTGRARTAASCAGSSPVRRLRPVSVGEA